MKELQRTIAVLGKPTASKAMLVAERELTVARWQHGPKEIEVGDGNTINIILNLSQVHRVERRHRGIWSTKPSGLGSITVTDPEETTAFRIDGEADVLQLFVSKAIIADALGFAKENRIRPSFLECRPRIERCAWRALSYLQDEDGSNPWFVSEIVSQLAGGFAESEGIRRPAAGGLSIQARRRVEELINDRLGGTNATSPSLRELASIADLSVFHFSRCFRHTVGVTPHAYLLRRRIDIARALLATPRLTVREASRRSGFRSAAHFTDRFRREIGVTPTVFQRSICG